MRKKYITVDAQELFRFLVVFFKDNGEYIAVGAIRVSVLGYRGMMKKSFVSPFGVSVRNGAAQRFPFLGCRTPFLYIRSASNLCEECITDTHRLRLSVIDDKAFQRPAWMHLPRDRHDTTRIRSHSGPLDSVVLLQTTRRLKFRVSSGHGHVHYGSYPYHELLTRFFVIFFMDAKIKPSGHFASALQNRFEST